MIAGIVLTYTGAFRVGDRVKLGDAFGDIIDMSLLATRIRTIKNEDITIPEQPRAGRLDDELLAPRPDRRTHPPHQRHHRLRRAVAEAFTSC